MYTICTNQLQFRGLHDFIAREYKALFARRVRKHPPYSLELKKLCYPSHLHSNIMYVCMYVCVCVQHNVMSRGERYI